MRANQIIRRHARTRQSRLAWRWLFTDDRLGNSGTAEAVLWQVLGRLPADVGVIVRHRDQRARLHLARAIRKQLARRGHRGPVLIAGDIGLARAAGVDGLHLPAMALRSGQHLRPGRLLVTAAAHTVPEAVCARRCGADALFISPVYRTQSHPGTSSLQPHGFARVARLAGPGLARFALGGMSQTRWRALRPLGCADGYGGIECWT